MQTKLARTLIFVMLSALIITASYFLIDRQLVWFLVAHHSRHFRILKIFANDITLIIGAMIFLYFIYFLVKLTINKVSIFDRKFIIVCNAVVISLFIKDILKIIFGRFWAATFVNNNPSLINNNAYGFNWFHGGPAYSSFPSGHTSFIFAFAASMWFLFPKLRILWFLLAILVALSQIGMYYHYVSDVIAGATLGSLVGIYTVYYHRQSSTRHESL